MFFTANKSKRFYSLYLLPIFLIIFASITSICRVLVSAGSALFTLPKFMHYFIGEENNPVAETGTIAMVLSSVLLNLVTRIPAYFYFFLHKTPIIPATPPAQQIPLKTSSKIIYVSLASVPSMNLVFVLLGSYLNSLSLIEYLGKKTSTNPHAEDAEQWTQTLALFLALGATLGFGIFSLRRAIPNARKFSQQLVDHTLPRDYYVWITLMIACIAMVATPFTSQFTTINSLSRLPFRVKDDWKFALSYLSGACATITFALNQIPATYESLSTHEQGKSLTPTPKWVLPSKIIVFGVLGPFDFSSTVLSNYISTVNTTVSLPFTPIHQSKNMFLIIFALLAALSNAVPTFCFSVIQAYADTLKKILSRHADYMLIKNDIETGLVTSSRRSSSSTNIFQLTQKSRLTLYGTAPLNIARISINDDTTYEEEEFAIIKQADDAEDEPPVALSTTP